MGKLLDFMKRSKNPDHKLVCIAPTKVLWLPDVRLRNKIIVFKRLERKYGRLEAKGIKQVDNYLTRFPDMDKKVKARRRRAMLERAKAIPKAKLTKKACRLQAEIDVLINPMQT